MNQKNRSSGIWLVVTLACLGFGLVTVPTHIFQQYETMREAGGLWTTIYAATAGVGFLLLTICCLWIVGKVWWGTLRKKRRLAKQSRNPSQMSAVERDREINENLSAVDDLKNDAAVDEQVRRELDPLVDAMETKRESQTLEIVAFGTVSSGKSSLLNALAGRTVFASDPRGGTTTTRNEVNWPDSDKVVLVDTPGLGEIDGETRQSLSAEAARDADLVLLVVEGPLRNSEHQLLDTLARMEKPVLVCLNKEDWFSPEDRDKLLGQLAKQLKGQVEPPNIVAVRSRPTTRPRVYVDADQGQREETVEVEPDISPLADRMLEIVAKDGRDLLLANLLLQSRGLIEEARQRVRKSLDRQAWSVVERYMWGAGGAAALSPFPVVDVIAGCAVSTKMVLDLAKVYRQDIDTDVAVRLLGQLGKNLLAILGTSLAMPAFTSLIASMLKTVPGVGTIAGGTLQGVVVALMTRWIGGVFIVYFGDEMREPTGGLASLARDEWKKATSVEELRKLVRAARSYFRESQ
jgi:small GTP-binding protein